MFNTILAHAESTGSVYGTTDMSLYLYAHARMTKPQVICEFGTGFGTTAFMLAEACRANGGGHVYTQDDGSDWQSSDLAYPDYIHKMTREFDLAPWLTMDYRSVDWQHWHHWDHLDRVDLIFNDISATPLAWARLIAWAIPRVHDTCWICIDRGATYWPCYSAIELTLAQLDQGRVPGTMLRASGDAQLLTRLASQFRYSVQYTVKALDPQRGVSTEQDSFALVKIERVDIGYRL